MKVDSCTVMPNLFHNSFPCGNVLVRAEATSAPPWEMCWATVEFVPTVSTKTKNNLVRIDVQGSCISLPLLMSELLTCFVSGSV
jgi:hypothetical protein